MVGATFVIVVLTATVVLVVDARRGTAVVTPILVLQLFAAASGFGGAARRGYFDLLFTSGHSRAGIAMAHWLGSIAPGVVSWLAVAVIEQLTSAGARHSVLATGTCAAMLVVSTLPWALCVNLPRFAASVGWILVGVSLASLTPQGLTGWMPMERLAEGSVPAAAAFVLYPFILAGRQIGGPDLTTVLPAIAVAVTSMVLACWWIGHADYPLEASQ